MIRVRGRGGRTLVSSGLPSDDPSGPEREAAGRQGHVLDDHFEAAGGSLAGAKRLPQVEDEEDGHQGIVASGTTP